jgi:NitT/TauT family transport system substrate-binding protein
MKKPVVLGLCLALAVGFTLNGCRGKKDTESEAIDVPTKGDKDYDQKMKAALKQLQKKKVYGLPKSVSEYAFIRNLELLGENPKDYQFTQMDPDAAAKNLQTNTAGVEAIMVWNPFVLQTLKVRKDAKVLFDSSSIPEEIIDMVVISEETLNKPGGKEFACAVIDTYYQFNQKLADKARRDELLVALGAKFSKLNLDEMKKATEQTRFYDTPKKGLALFTGDKFPETMKKVVRFYEDHQFIEKVPTIGFGSKDKSVRLRFDPSYIQMVKDSKDKKAKGGGDKPVFKLAWSEYPSWSVFGVASDIGLINGEKGKLGPIEEKWGVDIQLALLEYEPCINAYQAGECEGVCITNLDVLAPALKRKSVAVMPTSTSVGADACIVISKGKK